MKTTQTKNTELLLNTILLSTHFKVIINAFILLGCSMGLSTMPLLSKLITITINLFWGVTNTTTSTFHRRQDNFPSVETITYANNLSHLIILQRKTLLEPRAVHFASKANETKNRIINTRERDQRMQITSYFFQLPNCNYYGRVKLILCRQFSALV